MASFHLTLATCIARDVIPPYPFYSPPHTASRFSLLLPARDVCSANFKFFFFFFCSDRIIPAVVACDPRTCMYLKKKLSVRTTVVTVWNFGCTGWLPEHKHRFIVTTDTHSNTPMWQDQMENNQLKTTTWRLSIVHTAFYYSTWTSSTRWRGRRSGGADCSSSRIGTFAHA